MDHPLIGRRLRLVRCNDANTTLLPGDLGTVSHVDDIGTVHVEWDNGSTLGLVPREDAWTILSKES